MNLPSHWSSQKRGVSGSSAPGNETGKERTKIRKKKKNEKENEMEFDTSAPFMSSILMKEDDDEEKWSQFVTHEYAMPTEYSDDKTMMDDESGAADMTSGSKQASRKKKKRSSMISAGRSNALFSCDGSLSKSFLPSSVASSASQPQRKKPKNTSGSHAAHASDPPSSLRDLARSISQSMVNTAPSQMDPASMLQLDTVLSGVSYREILQNLFGDNEAVPADVPVISKAYEEAFLRECITPNERPCVMGADCEGNFISRTHRFTLTEFLLPGEVRAEPRMCVLCCRKHTQKMYYDLLYSPLACQLGLIQRLYGADAELQALCYPDQEYGFSERLTRDAVRIVRLKEEGAPPCEAAFVVEQTGSAAGGLGNTLKEIIEEPHVSTRLNRLHTLLPTCPSVRTVIDRHLLASAISPSNPSSNFVLQEADVFHYHNLPNLVPQLRMLLISQAWVDDDLLGALMSPFCLHINRTLRPQSATPIDTPASVQCAALNLLHGLLLGLYPYNVRQPGYNGRVRIVSWVRNIMCCAPGRRAAFIDAHPGLMGLAAIEYLANVVADYCPVEETLLVRPGSSCRFIINNLCDALRSELITLFDADEKRRQSKDLTSAEIAHFFLSQVEPRAAASFAAAQRQLKLCNHRPCRRTATRYMTRKIPRPLLDTILNTAVVGRGCGGNSAAQIQMLRPDFTYADIQAMEFVWSNFSIYNLPISMREAQQKSLEAKGSCALVQHALSTIHICVGCALSSKGCILNHRCSYKCSRSTLHCTHCQGIMQRVNLVGRALRVRQSTYCLCPCCLRPVRWDSAPLPSQCRRCAEEPAIAPRCCAVCDRRNVAVVREIVDCERLEFVRVPLCHKHAKRVMSARSSAVYDILGFQADMHAASAHANETRGQSDRLDKKRVVFVSASS